MAGHAPPVGLSEQDFDLIEDAVMETARGRWFLREYARRMRASDTNRLLDAMARLERVVTGQSADQGSGARTAYFASALEIRRERLATLAECLREQGYDGDLCGRIAREAQGLADVIDEMRCDEPQDVPARPATASAADPWCEADDPHASAPYTIDASALPEGSAGEDATGAAEPPQIECFNEPDLGALACIDALPFKDKLALFS